MPDSHQQPGSHSSTLRAAACGKVILLGEHAVVYGVPALCGALQGGVEVEASAGRGALQVREWNLVTQTAAELLQVPDSDVAGIQPALAVAYRAILRSVLAASGRGDTTVPWDFSARFAIPTGAGLGSSAALSVALIRAIDNALQLHLTSAAVDAAAFLAEQVFHGSPSGLDHTVAQQGGFGLYRRGQGLTPIVGTPSLRLIIGHTGRARDTKGRVGRVAELFRQDPVTIQACFDRIAQLVDQAVVALRQNDLSALGAAMNQNQRELAQLEVSCPEIESMCQLGLEAGALGVKLTGGGGGGCVVALAPGREEQVRSAWLAHGYQSFPVEIGPAVAATINGQ